MSFAPFDGVPLRAALRARAELKTRIARKLAAQGVAGDEGGREEASPGAGAFGGKTAARELVGRAAKSGGFGEARIDPRPDPRALAREAAARFTSGLKQAALKALRKA